MMKQPLLQISFLLVLQEQVQIMHIGIAYIISSKSWFYGSVTNSMQIYLPRGVTEARQWSYLQQVFSTTSQVRIIDLRLELQTMNKNE